MTPSDLPSSSVLLWAESVQLAILLSRITILLYLFGDPLDSVDVYATGDYDADEQHNYSS